MSRTNAQLSFSFGATQSLSPKCKERRRHYYERNRARLITDAKERYRVRRLALGRIVKPHPPKPKSDEERKQRKAAAFRHWATANPEKRRPTRLDQILARRMGGSMRRAFRLKKIPSDKRNRRFEQLVGYTALELIRHIEKQFRRGMTWQNRGRRWHIDHIRPVASFNFQSVDDPEFRACWALTNLRPIWAPQNLTKAAKRQYLL